MKRNRLLLIVTTMLLIFSGNSFAYPFIISEHGVNHTKSKELVYSVSEEYYKYVYSVEFVDGSAHCKFVEEINQTQCWDGWYWAYWYVNYNKYDWCKAKIILHKDGEKLIHELGHIYWICELKKLTFNEAFANNFEWVMSKLMI